MKENIKTITETKNTKSPKLIGYYLMSLLLAEPNFCKAEEKYLKKKKKIKNDTKYKYHWSAF